MDLRSGKYYWPSTVNTGLTTQPLNTDTECEIAIIGGGITAALMAYYLSKAGHDCMVLEKNDFCCGSTIASTSILQYEIDVSLQDLSARIGPDGASLAYKLCDGAVSDLISLSQKVSRDALIQPKSSLYLAQHESESETLKTEYELRRRLDINVEFLTKEEIQGNYSFSAPAALYSMNAGIANSFALGYELFSLAAAGGCRLHVNSRLTSCRHLTGSAYSLLINGKHTVRCKYLLFCTGYESCAILKEKIADLVSTYALTTKPLSSYEGWKEQCIIWETSRPYFYIRPAPDGRAMIGGADKPFRFPFLRDIYIPFVSRKLLKKFNTLFPAANAETEYCWAGTFGETKDGLGYIGVSPEYEGAFFALGFGGNGMTFARIAVDMFFDFLHKRPNAAFEIFRFGR